MARLHTISAGTKRKLIRPYGFINQQNKIIKEINEYVGRFNPKEIVVWGAGHQALTVMSLANLQNKVAYVIDSAPFKQNKYTPATRLLIKSPSSILVDKPKAILVMAAAYSDEVVKIITTNYKNVKHVAILREGSIEVVEGE